jgi:hypothetical protein
MLAAQALIRRCAMAGIETITMSMREIDRLKVIQTVVDGNLKPMQAAQRYEPDHTANSAAGEPLLP